MSNEKKLCHNINEEFSFGKRADYLVRQLNTDSCLDKPGERRKRPVLF